MEYNEATKFITETIGECLLSPIFYTLLPNSFSLDEILDKDEEPIEHKIRYALERLIKSFLKEKREIIPEEIAMEMESVVFSSMLKKIDDTPQEREKIHNFILKTTNELINKHCRKL